MRPARAGRTRRPRIGERLAALSGQRGSAGLSLFLVRHLVLDEREDLSPEEQVLAELLTILIENYEDKAFPLARVSPGDSLKALMEDRGLKHGFGILIRHKRCRELDTTFAPLKP